LQRPHGSSLQMASQSPTISSSNGSHLEKHTKSDSEELATPRHSSATESHHERHHPGEGFGRASEVESLRPPSLYPSISYASQIGGVGGVEDEPEIDQTAEKDPNLVEWDGPNDPKNPYNWYSRF
jgi:hypothetical protein